MDHPLKQLRVVFYRSASGNEPGREWLKSLPAADRRIIGADIKTVEFGWPIGIPTCKSLGAGIWEVRSNLPGDRLLVSSSASRTVECIS